jgi:hypothetical protein
MERDEEELSTEEARLLDLLVGLIEQYEEKHHVVRRVKPHQGRKAEKPVPQNQRSNIVPTGPLLKVQWSHNRSNLGFRFGLGHLPNSAQSPAPPMTVFPPLGNPNAPLVNEFPKK